MPVTWLHTFAASDTTYVADTNNNFSILKDFCDSLEAAVSALGGDGADLFQDLWDRDGIVGPQSYMLDLDAYAGGSFIDIGRRPSPVAPEVDESVAALSINGTYTRVSLSGDVTLNAAGIIAGLPKTIYVGVGSNGVPQLFESTATLNILYVWSMRWDGVDLSDFRRIAPILPAYGLVQKVAGQPQQFQVYDPETNFVEDAESSVRLLLPGGAAGNGIDVDGAFEVLGFFCSVGPEAADGFASPVAGSAADALVELDVYAGATKFTDAPLEIDTDNLPAYAFAAVESGLGDEKYITGPTQFHLEPVSVGANVTCAAGILWGVLVRPLLGNVLAPRDPSGTLV